MKTLTVELNEKSYPIIINYGLLDNIKNAIEANYKGKGRFFIITNKTIYSIYKEMLSDFDNIIQIEDGEEFKNFKTFELIMDKLLEAKIERGDCIIAFGGGVVGDMAGFAAASVLRGIDYIQIPTTLLSQVDSSVGGKTGFNHKMGKNLIGAFKQPKLVLIDPKTLDTLDKRQIKTGLGEVLKYAFIEKSATGKNFEFFNLLKVLSDNANGNLYNKLKNHWEEIIHISVSMKADVVAKDEQEKDLRAILNFGHTFAHALEKITGYKKYTHGEAVAAGMIMAFNTAILCGFINKEYYNSAVELIKNYNLISDDIKNLNRDEMFNAMKSDKKVNHSLIKLVLPIKPFEVQLFDDIKEPLIKDSLL